MGFSRTQGSQSKTLHSGFTPGTPNNVDKRSLNDLGTFRMDREGNDIYYTLLILSIANISAFSNAFYTLLLKFS